MYTAFSGYTENTCNLVAVLSYLDIRNVGLPVNIPNDLALLELPFIYGIVYIQVGSGES